MLGTAHAPNRSIRSIRPNLFKWKLGFSPSVRFDFWTQHILTNMALFCTSPNNCTPLCKDTTYGIGNLFVMTTSYKNLKVLNKGKNEHPSFTGPALFHVDQDESIFSYFSQTLIALELSLRSILFIGSDRDCALINGTNNYFLIAKNLFCVMHVEDDIECKLSSMHHISGKVK